MAPSTFFIYGANGYTGKMIAREAVKRGLQPILAGRNGSAVRELARELGLRSQVFDCIDGEAIARELKRAAIPENASVREDEVDIPTVLHCAGPFSATCKPMLSGCLKAGCHYLDIAGEIPVFERVLSRPELYRTAGIVAIPGVGFDVVPTDCVAALLKEKLPDASELVLAIKIAGEPSPGSFKTLTEGLHAGSLVRKNGKLVPVPAGSATRQIPFLTGEALALRVPWADISSAFYSTGIPNIETYITIRPQIMWIMRASRYARPLLKLKSVQKLMAGAIKATLRGPDAQSRTGSSFEIWAEVRNDHGDTRQLHVKTPNGYDLTVDSSLKAVAKVLAGQVNPGSYSPSQAFSPKFLMELDGVEVLGDFPI